MTLDYFSLDTLCSNKTGDNCFGKLTLNSIAISSFVTEMASSQIAPELFIQGQISFRLRHPGISAAPIVKEAVNSAR